MGFVHPELLLLLVPAAFVWWRLRGRGTGTQVARAVALALLALAVAAPYLRTGEAGRDLVIVVDRSRSMPGETDATVREIARVAEDARREGDRVAVVAFGGNAAIEQLPQRDARFQDFQRAVDRDASDLGGALEAALALIPRERQGSVLLVSDGEGNGRDGLGVARAAFARDVRIDVRPMLRGSEPDLAVDRIELPAEVGAAEPFQFAAWVRADAPVEADYELLRDGEVLARGRRKFEPGLNRIAFRDLLARAGIAQYRLRLSGHADRAPENDVGLGAVRIAGQRSLLVVNHDGAEDTLTSTLRKAGIPVLVASPETARLDRIVLTRHRAVVLENVEAARIGGEGLRALREFVLERGGGLWMTGGQASFGIGGWHLSPVDEVLPVSMEMRHETRKIGVALAIALDRSGSMAVEASPGVPKMKLANLGACAAIELLSPLDSVAVLAVDSSAHVVQALTPAENIGAITSRVRQIESMGGGIFTYEALLAAGRELERASQRNRHIVLFADANDAEQPEGVPELLQRFRRSGVTVSVVALGTERDIDADFLKRTAKMGDGECYFTLDPEELPRLFAQDTMRIARSTFVEEPASTRVLPDLYGLGELDPSAGFPTFGGHNLVWLRDDATAGALVESEFRSPAFSFAYRGLGRTAAFAGQIGGTYGADVVAWPGFASFVVTVARWLSGQEEPSELFASAQREGRDGVISVEVDPRASTPPDLSRARVRMTGADGTTTSLPLERVAENRYEARLPLVREGVLLGSVELGRDDKGNERMLSLPPLALPYSPEFERSSDVHRGERALRAIARESGGEVAPPLGTLLRGPREARVWRVVSRELILAALVVLLVEIAARRLQLWGSLEALLASLAARLRRRLGRPKLATAAAGAPSTPAAPPKAGPPSPPPVAEPAKPAETLKKPSGSLDDALNRARRNARRELDR